MTPPGIAFEVQYRSNPRRTLAVMHTGAIAPFVLAIAARLSRGEALEALAAHLEQLAQLARGAKYDPDDCGPDPDDEQDER